MLWLSREQLCGFVRLLVCLCLLPVQIGTEARAAPAAGQREPVVALRVSRVSLPGALQQLFAGTGYDYRLRSAATGTITIEIPPMPLSRALDLLLAAEQGEDALVWIFQPRGEGGTYDIQREQISLTDSGDRKSIRLSRARFSRAVALLLGRLGMPHRVEKGLPDAPIDLQMRPNSWFDALTALLKTAAEKNPEIALSLDRGSLVVHSRSSALQAEAWSRPVNPAPGRRPLRRVLHEILGAAAIPYRVDDSVPDPMIQIEKAPAGPLPLVLDRLLAAGGAAVTYRVSEGVVLIEPGIPAGAAERLRELLEPRRAGLTLQATGRLRSAAARLARGAGIALQVSPLVPDLPVDLHLKEASIEEALTALTGSIKGLHGGVTWQKKEGYYLILPRFDP